MLFPSNAIAVRCVDFFTGQVPALKGGRDLRIIDFVPSRDGTNDQEESDAFVQVSAVIFPRNQSNIAKTFWQHTGDGISSRRAEACHKAFKDGALVARGSGIASRRQERICKGPRRYQKGSFTEKVNGISREVADDNVTTHGLMDRKDYIQFVEERFGRNLNVSLAANAKRAIRRRIAGSLTANLELDEALNLSNEASAARQAQGVSEDDVYLYPTGMSSIFNTHRVLLEARGSFKSISFGYDRQDESLMSKTNRD